jgi:hypothetical protein
LILVGISSIEAVKNLTQRSLVLGLIKMVGFFKCTGYSKVSNSELGMKFDSRVTHYKVVMIYRKKATKLFVLLQEPEPFKFAAICIW